LKTRYSNPWKARRPLSLRTIKKNTWATSKRLIQKTNPLLLKGIFYLFEIFFCIIEELLICSMKFAKDSPRSTFTTKPRVIHYFCRLYDWLRMIDYARNIFLEARLLASINQGGFFSKKTYG
jgi:hypothetical protein